MPKHDELTCELDLPSTAPEVVIAALKASAYKGLAEHLDGHHVSAANRFRAVARGMADLACYLAGKASSRQASKRRGGKVRSTTL
jgi:hypothetical protein